VKNIEDNKLFACKTIYCEKEEYLTESLKEVRFLRSNRHPAIIDVHDCFITAQPRVLYIVMSYCETSTIAKVISTHKKNSTTISEKSITNWVMQVLTNDILYIILY
jgi:serine/threonine protein kinase